MKSWPHLSPKFSLKVSERKDSAVDSAFGPACSAMPRGEWGPVPGRVRVISSPGSFSPPKIEGEARAVTAPVELRRQTANQYRWAGPVPLARLRSVGALSGVVQWRASRAGARFAARLCCNPRTVQEFFTLNKAGVFLMYMCQQIAAR